MHENINHNSWYGFSTLTGVWGALCFEGYIKSSRGRIELPVFDGIVDWPLYLVGAVYKGKLLMGGQSQNGNGTLFYTGGEWFRLGLSFGVSPCAFSQDGRFFYFVTSSLMGTYRDNENGALTPFETPFFVDGIRAVIPPTNKLILGNTTNYSPVYDLHQYIDFENGLVVGQGASGLVVWYNGIKYLIEPGGTFFIRAMYDGFNIALATVKEQEKQLVNWFINLEELRTFPHADEDPIVTIGKPCWMTWFEFNNAPPGLDTPLNATVYSGEGVIRNFDSGEKFAQWVQGDSVESIENQIAAIDEPVVAYWDGRTWPRFPV
jgi:hypothetical protein